ncbi:MAG TPA: PRC-barrel domain-containing protein [Candidatus Magasanikbacteria bacterium]|jgi:sporulation protein YlmC with PRC-barrel domain|nr:PRC-barrel domain containing protein [Candidatus Magasanikbacteria bacterium]HQF57020.1 PRC-barrel domain-containing protein [Candidatus Magasanikbacteria bacterium]HQL52949.1 PRC-barrel domain-containing protein [Candidatus Magasanikbacteria bacterium]
MKINLKNLKVQTKSGVNLGKVYDIVLDTKEQIIWQYEIRNLLGKRYLISPLQIISINNQKMIVEDNIIKTRIENIVENKINREPEGIVMDQVG